MITHTTKHRPLLYVALLGILTFFLTACGAAVNTTLQLDSAEKGSRTMVLELDSSDSESSQIKGGMEAVEGSIRKHLPEGLEFGGIEADESGSRATFTLTFDSVESYEAQVQSLLDASGKDITADIVISLSDTGLVRGTTVSENFTSTDLLGWINDALKADGVYTGSGSIFSSTDETIVRVGDKEFESLSRIKVSEITDNGVSNLAVQLVIEDDGSYTGHVAFGDTSPMGSVKLSAVNEYIEANAPEGAEVSTIDKTTFSSTNLSNITHGQLVTFSAANTDEFSQKVQKLLGSDKNKFSVSDKISDKDKTLFLANVDATIDCPQVCSPTGYGPRFDVVTPTKWESLGSSSGQSTSSSTSMSIIKEYSYTLEFSSVDVTFDLNGDGGGKATFSYDLATEQANLAGDGLESFLAPAEDTGSIKHEESDGTTNYTVVIEGKDAEELTSKLSKYIPNASIKTGDIESGFGIWREYGLTVYLPLNSSNYSSTLTNGYSLNVNLPSSHKIEKTGQGVSVGAEVSDRSVSFDSESDTSDKLGFTVTVKAPAWGNIILLGAIFLVALLAILVLWIFRKKIFASLPQKDKGTPQVVAPASTYAPVNSYGVADDAVADKTVPLPPRETLSAPESPGTSGNADGNLL